MTSLETPAQMCARFNYGGLTDRVGWRETERGVRQNKKGDDKALSLEQSFLSSAGANAVETIFRWSEERHRFWRSNQFTRKTSLPMEAWGRETECQPVFLLTTFIHSITKQVLRQKSTAGGNVRSMLRLWGVYVSHAPSLFLSLALVGITLGSPERMNNIQPSSNSN